MRDLTDVQMEELERNKPRVFSYQQEREIELMEKQCAEAGCEDTHKCSDE